MLLKKRKYINKNKNEGSKLKEKKLTTKKRKLWEENQKERDELQDGQLKVRKEAKSAEMLEKNISLSHLESKQMQTNCAEGRTGSELARKQKRPWRQMIRHQAKRERLALEHGDHEQKPGSEEPENESTQLLEETKKAKKKSRKKRLKQKQRILGPKEGLEEIAGVSGQKPIQVSTKTQDQMVARLDASRFRYLNEQLYTKPSTSAAQLFQEDPNAFVAYHKGYQQQLKRWPVNPLNTILLDLCSLPKGSVIADCGCGEAELAHHLGDEHIVHSFDLVAANDRVVAADIANLPLENASVDVCVYCLSLMGTNLAHFFREAHRVLKKGGKMKIAEVASRFQNVKAFINALAKMGFQLKRKKEIGDGFFHVMSFQKVGKIESKRPQGLQLMPCLYKKR